MQEKGEGKKRGRRSSPGWRLSQVGSLSCFFCRAVLQAAAGKGRGKKEFRGKKEEGGGKRGSLGAKFHEMVRSPLSSGIIPSISRRQERLLLSPRNDEGKKKWSLGKRKGGEEKGGPNVLKNILCHLISIRPYPNLRIIEKVSKRLKGEEKKGVREKREGRRREN